MVGEGARRRISILGATGSVGRSTLAVLRANPGRYQVAALTAGRDAKALAALVREFGAELAVVADPAAYSELKAELSGSGIKTAAGGDAAVAAAVEPSAEIVLSAIVGAAGLEPALAALQAGRTLALANKEPLVCAGHLFMRTARQAGATVLPVDSEHNAIFQALAGQGRETVERIILTASGGPFRDASRWPIEALARARVEDALRHPNWSMGQKITVDSSTLMNKGLEVIEAHHLFGLPAEKIEVLVHPQSAVHGIVVYSDGSMLAQLGSPDMRIPIAHCLAWPERMAIATPRLDLAKLASLSFEEPDRRRFPALDLAAAALAAGGGATNILNAANEVAVAAFLAGAIGYLEIARLVGETLEKAGAENRLPEPATIEEALALDRLGREIARELAAGRGATRQNAAGASN